MKSVNRMTRGLANKFIQTRIFFGGGGGIVKPQFSVPAFSKILYLVNIFFLVSAKPKYKQCIIFPYLANISK
jgi:hypothetical protein